MKFWFAFGALLFSFGPAAAGCASSGDDSAPSTPGSQSTPGSFHGSCTTESDYSMSCAEDYHNSPAWMEAQCASASSTTTTATYSADHCSTIGLTGKCERWDWIEFYYNESDSASTLQDFCTRNGGKWSSS